MRGADGALANLATGTPYITEYTGESATGTKSFDLSTLYTSTAPYGWYYTKLDYVTSAPILYMPGGATLVFDEDTYTIGQSATLTYDISDTHWTPGSDYKIAVYSASSGANVYSNSSIVAQSGTASFEFESDASTGAYYAYLTKGSNTLGFDYAELDEYLVFYGFVKNESDLPIYGANINITQSSLTSASTSATDGNYTSGNFHANYPTILNITASGYSQYNVSLTPPVAKRVYLNFTLNSTSPSTSGAGIGGVARDGVFDETTRKITKGWGRPLSGVNVTIRQTVENATSCALYGTLCDPGPILYYNKTNNAGWYLCDEGASCFLTSPTSYMVQGSKNGYNTSQNYTVVTA